MRNEKCWNVIDRNQIFATTKAIELENNRADTKHLSLA